MILNLNDFLANKDSESGTSDPQWVLNGTPNTKKLYHATINEYELIAKRIEIGNDLSIRERSIKKTSVAKSCNLDKSLINKRRQKELTEFIDKLNDDLSNLWLKKNRSRSSKNKTKVEIKKENAILKHKISEKKNDDLVKFYAMAIEMELLKTQRNLADELINARQEIKELTDYSSNIKSQLDQQKFVESGLRHQIKELKRKLDA